MVLLVCAVGTRLFAVMDEGHRRTSEARLAAEALLSHSITRSSSLNAINYGSASHRHPLLFLSAQLESVTKHQLN